MFVIGGDFNVTRSTYSTASQALWRLCYSNNLLWLEPESNDIGFTFHLHFSLIDHFLCSPSLTIGSEVTNILADGDNTSDHLAISVTLYIPTHIDYIQYKPDRPVRLKWERAEISEYQNLVASHLSCIDIPIDALLCCKSCTDHRSTLDKYYTDIVRCLYTSAKLCVPEVKVGIEKHWWSPELDDLKDQCIEATTLWRMAGCPRSGDVNTNRVKIKLRYKN